MSNVERNVAEARKKNNPWWVGIASRALIFWGEHMMRTEIKGKENLQEATDYVNTGKGGLIVTPNHNSYIDAEFMMMVKEKIDPKKRFSVLWANKFVGNGEGKYTKTGQEDPKKVSAAGKIGLAAAKRIGIELVDVPQETNDLGTARKIIRHIKEIGKEILGNNNVLGVFLEGTRSRDGNLGEAKRALRILFENSEINSRILILPIAATGTGEYLSPDSEKVNPLAKVIIIYGKPYNYKQALEEMERFNLPIETILMWHIGQLLPKEKWGIYIDAFSKIQDIYVKQTETY